MQDICLKIENLFEKAGQSHYYQYSITILFTILYCCTHFMKYFIPYLERVPELSLKGTGENEEFSYDLCHNLTEYNIEADNKLQTSLVYEFNIICNKKKIYFIGLCYYVGKFIGSCISYLFIDRIGRKLTLFIFTPISIVLMALFKFMKASYSYNWIYGIYVDLFLFGISNYIIVVSILIYISEIVKQTKIPYFITAVCSGASIAGFAAAVTFHGYRKLDWRDICLIFAGIHLFVYIILLFLFIGSPIFSLNMENFEDFSLCLRQIAKRNGKQLELSDFTFLKPYMKKESRNKMFGRKENPATQVNLQTDQSSSLSGSDDNNRNNFLNNSTKMKILDKELAQINDTSHKDVNYTNGNNQIYSNNQLMSSANPNSIFIKNKLMKDVYLLSSGEDADVPVKSLFGDSKMKDFTPLDLLRFNSQIKNFLVLSFIWIVTDIIRTGIDFRKKYIIEYIGKIEFPIATFCLEIFLAIVLLAIYYKYNYSIQKILITASLFQFVFFVFVGFYIQKMHDRAQVVFLMLAKVACHQVYLVINVITLEIYPIMIRTIGVGFNIGFSAIGTIVTIFLVENLDFDSLILYFLIFNFFSLVICYGLPMKIGTLILDNPKLLKEQEDEDDVKLGDICVENAILVKSGKKEKPEVEKKETIIEKKDSTFSQIIPAFHKNYSA